MNDDLQLKLAALKSELTKLGSVAVAFSGGVDSTFLLKIAHDTLGDKAVAFTASSEFVPQRDVKEAINFCTREGIRQVVKDFSVLAIEGVAANPVNRCYLCKYALFSEFKAMAANMNLNYVVDGSNLDDDGDYRPGRQALQELAIVSPLHKAGFTKQAIRDVSHELKLATWDKPSFACLASRFVYGETLSVDKLQQVNCAEEALLQLGFKQFRVRRHGDLARIELLPADMKRFMADDYYGAVANKFKELGFSYVTLDLIGFRSGSMNEVLVRP